MPKLPEVTRVKGTVHIGDTFCLEVTLYDDEALSILTDLTGYTPVATLTTDKAVEENTFSCTYLAVTEDKPKRILMVLPIAATSLLAHSKTYYGKLSLKDAEDATYLKLIAELTAERI